MRTVVTGASGMLGSAIHRELVERREPVEGWSRSVPVDLTETKEVDRILRASRPELIIHCAALTDADFCEANQRVAWIVNGDIPGDLALTAKAIGARFIYISTDAVYDDDKPGRRREDERPNPKSVYAETKLEGEGRVLAVYPEALVVRTTMFGWTLPTAPRPKFAEQILAALTAGEPREPKPLWTDAIFSPLHVDMLGEILLDLAEMDVSGVLNVGSRHPVSKWDFGWQMAVIFDLDWDGITTALVDDVPLPARRTKNVGLNVKAVERLLGPMPTVEMGIVQLYQEATYSGVAKKIRERETYP